MPSSENNFTSHHFTRDGRPSSSAAATHAAAHTPAARDTASKILLFDTLCQAIADARHNKTVVLCHGVFDLLHIGHIKHLQAARQLGDILVVTITPDQWVNKGPGRPAFTQQLRAEALASLACVDYVAVNLWPKAVDTLHHLKPDIFAKGADYTDRTTDHSGNLNEEEQAVLATGGRLVITPGQIFSSSNLINAHLSDLPQTTRDYLDNFATTKGLAPIVAALDRAATLNILVVGDAIIDQYDYCSAIGKSSKEPVLTVKAATSETFAGGILAVANHLAAFAPKTTLITTLGTHDSYEDFITQSLNKNITTNFIHRDDAPTIVKQRFIDTYFFQKLFEVYKLNDAAPDDAYDRAITTAIERLAPEADLVLVVDFGHQTLTPNAIAALAKHARFLAVNAQSNAGNLGYHTISKYPRADLICLAENELRLEARDRQGSIKPMMTALAEKLHAQNIIVTRGSKGAAAYHARTGFAQVPAVATTVKDRMGAGDTFMAAAALCIAAGLDIESATLAGNAAGAQAVATVGHSRFLDRISLIKHIQCLLK